MKVSLAASLILLIFSTSVAVADNTPPATASNTESQPASEEKMPSADTEAECLQCGTWQISGGPAGLEGQILIIDKTEMLIPGCGAFDYSLKPIEVTSSGKLTLTMSLQQKQASFLCPGEKGDAWSLDIKLSGHFRENSIAEFNIHRGQSAITALALYGWNREREDPCSSGSGIGSSVCNSIGTSLTYIALSDQVARAYGKLLDLKIKKPPSFNPARFHAAALRFCIEREKNSGFDAWPMAHAYGCQSDILQRKHEEFESWSSCMHGEENKLSSCKFPDESFGRSRK